MNLPTLGAFQTLSFVGSIVISVVIFAPKTLVVCRLFAQHSDVNMGTFLG